MTALMKILKVEGVIHRLVNGIPVVISRADLIFDNPNNSAYQQQCVYALTHPRNRKFKEYVAAREVTELLLQTRDLLNPSILLRSLESEMVLIC